MPKLSEKMYKKVYVPDDPTGAWVELVYLKKGVRERIDQDSNETIGGIGPDGEFQTTIKFNLKKKRSMWLKEAINSWGGFLDKKGKETRPTENNIRKFSEEFDLFGWLDKEMDEWIEEVEGEEKPAQVNSES